MDHSSEILTELRSLRTEVTRMVVKLEEMEKREGDMKGSLAAMEVRLRAVELGQATRLAAAGLGSGGLVALIQAVIQHFGS